MGLRLHLCKPIRHRNRQPAIVAAFSLSRFSSARSTATRAADDARVPHLVGALRRTTTLASPHRLMPVLVPAVMPLVSANKANQPRRHGGPPP